MANIYSLPTSFNYILNYFFLFISYIKPRHAKCHMSVDRYKTQVFCFTIFINHSYNYKQFIKNDNTSPVCIVSGAAHVYALHHLFFIAINY